MKKVVSGRWQLKTILKATGLLACAPAAAMAAGYFPTLTAPLGGTDAVNIGAWPNYARAPEYSNGLGTSTTATAAASGLGPNYAGGQAVAHSTVLYVPWTDKGPDGSTWYNVNATAGQQAKTGTGGTTYVVGNVPLGCGAINKTAITTYINNYLATWGPLNTASNHGMTLDIVVPLHFKTAYGVQLGPWCLYGPQYGDYGGYGLWENNFSFNGTGASVRDSLKDFLNTIIDTMKASYPGVPYMLTVGNEVDMFKLRSTAIASATPNDLSAPTQPSNTVLPPCPNCTSNTGTYNSFGVNLIDYLKPLLATRAAGSIYKGMSTNFTFLGQVTSPLVTTCPAWGAYNTTPDTWNLLSLVAKGLFMKGDFVSYTYYPIDQVTPHRVLAPCRGQAHADMMNYMAGLTGKPLFIQEVGYPTTYTDDTGATYVPPGRLLIPNSEASNPTGALYTEATKVSAQSDFMGWFFYALQNNRYRTIGASWWPLVDYYRGQGTTVAHVQSNWNGFRTLATGAPQDNCEAEWPLASTGYGVQNAMCTSGIIMHNVDANDNYLYAKPAGQYGSSWNSYRWWTNNIQSFPRSTGHQNY